MTAPQPVTAPQAAGVSSAAEILEGFRTLANANARLASYLQYHQAGGHPDKDLVHEAIKANLRIAAAAMPAPEGDQS